LKIPHHVAVIMDGNGRWAQQRGLPRFEGHRRGALKAERFVQWASEMGIKYVTLYAFSTENWRRPENEVNFLFSLLRSQYQNNGDHSTELRRKARDSKGPSEHRQQRCSHNRGVCAAKSVFAGCSRSRSCHKDIGRSENK